MQYWARQYPQDRIVVLDALTYAGNLASLECVADHDQYRFVKGDIVDRESVAALMREEQIDTIVHFAAESHVDRSIVGPGAFVETNVVGTHNLLQAARSLWLETMTLHQVTVFTTCRRTKFMAHWGRTTPDSMRRHGMHRILRIRQVRRLPIILCVPITIPTDCR